MTSTTEAPFKAIPTLYKGVQLRSRMEAQCALLFDTLGWKWKYEPFSIMLPNGVAYTPDFHIEGHDFVIECRGYDSEKGRKQVNGFADLVYGASNQLPCRVEQYMVVGSQSILEGLNLFLICYWIGFCPDCFMWSVIETESPACHICGRSPDIELSVSSQNGQVLLDGRVPSTEWPRLIGEGILLDRWLDNSLSRTLAVAGHHELSCKVENNTQFIDGKFRVSDESCRLDHQESSLLSAAISLVTSSNRRLA